MNQSKHTPGPWRTTKAGGTIRNDRNEIIAFIALGSECSEELRRRRKGNADLIAAAPDLLAACERAVAAAERPDDFIEGSAAYEYLRAVIAQARGEAHR